VNKKNQFGRAENLRKSADDAARQVRNIYITFLCVGIYIAIAIGSTTDEQLLRVTPVTLPIFDVRIPINWFYALVPWLLLFLHFNLLLQLYLLANKLHDWNTIIDSLYDEDQKQDQHTCLYPFAFSHMLIQTPHRRSMRCLFSFVVWSTIILLTPLLLIWAQFTFLPFHNSFITGNQIVVVLLDVVMLGFLWPKIVAPREGEKQDASSEFKESDRKTRGWIWVRSKANKVCANFLSTLSTRPVSMKIFYGILILLALSSFLKLFFIWPFHKNLILSGKVLVEEKLSPETISLLMAEYRAGEDKFSERKIDLTEEPVNSLEETKQPAEKEQVNSWQNTKKSLKNVVGIRLTQRDLRGADFRRVIMPKADLRGGNLDQIDLRQSKLIDADLRPFPIKKSQHCIDAYQEIVIDPEKQEDRFSTIEIHYDKEKICCTSLRGANLEVIDLSGAKLWQGMLRGANLSSAVLRETDFYRAELQKANFSASVATRTKFAEADLQGAILDGARLQFADFYAAKLGRASLQSATLYGSNLEYAQLQGANLEGAQLQGADLTGAWLQGADLTRAQLQGANLEGAQLQGANLSGAILSGANLKGANLDGANLKNVWLSGADLSDAKLRGADMRYAKIGGAKFDGTDLSACDLRKSNRNILTDKDEEYTQIKDYCEDKRNREYFTEIGLTDSMLKRILKPIEEAVGKRDNLGDPASAIMSDGAICDDRSVLANCLTEDEVEKYLRKLMDVLKEGGCSDRWIAFGLARRAISDCPPEMIMLTDQQLSGEIKFNCDLSRKIADMLLESSCSAGQDVPGDIKSELLKIVGRQSAEHNNTNR
jgi:uncharacterized protein YjbI with pentapeptide repeats